MLERPSASLFRYCQRCKQMLCSSGTAIQTLKPAGGIGDPLSRLCIEAIMHPSKKISFGYIEQVNGYEFLSIVWYFAFEFSNNEEWSDLARYASKEINLEHPISHCLYDSDSLKCQYRENLMAVIAWLLGDSSSKMIYLNEKFDRVIFLNGALYDHAKGYRSGMFSHIIKYIFPKKYRMKLFPNVREYVE